MNLFLRILFGILVTASLCSCMAHSAINRTENFQNSWPAVNYVTNKQVIVEVIDLRHDVVNKKVEPTYVGVIRAQFGNPWSMYTESGQPLAVDIATAIRNGLLSAGIKAVLPEQIASNHLATERKLTLKIYDWACDTYKTSDFNYDLEMQVSDSSNTTLGTFRDSSKSQENVTVQSVVDAGRHALTKLLNNDNISKAMK